MFWNSKNKEKNLKKLELEEKRTKLQDEVDRNRLVIVPVIDNGKNGYKVYERYVYTVYEFYGFYCHILRIVDYKIQKREVFDYCFSSIKKAKEAIKHISQNPIEVINV